MSFSCTITPDRAATESLALRQSRLLVLTASLALALACAWPLALNRVDSDLWGHVRYGQDLIAAGTLPQTATHTYTAVGHRWINHENLFELAIAACHNTWGVPGILLAKCLLGMTLVAAMVWVAGQRGVHPLVAWLLMLVVTINLEPFFFLRPQLLSFACCGAVVVLLDRAFSRWSTSREVDTRYLWCLPLVLVVWTNSHGGFVAGVCIVGAYLGGRIVELLGDKSGISWPQVGRLALVGLTCLAATLANPYGAELHLWLAKSLAVPRPEITEWLAPHRGDPAFWPWIAMLGISGLSLLASDKRRDWVEVSILLLVVWQSALHLRHIAFVALLCGFWLPVHFQAMLKRLLPTTFRALSAGFSPRVGRIAIAGLVVVIAAQCYALGHRLSHLPVDRGQYPVDALQYMANHHLEGNAVVAFNWSQYTLAALAPQIIVGFDGRYDTCYPPEVVDMHFDFELGTAGGGRHRSRNAGAIDGTKILDYQSPDLVIVDRHYRNAVEIMQAEATKPSPAWVLLYRDRVADIWGRTSKYGDPQSPQFIPPNMRVRDASPRAGLVPWPAFPVRPHDQLVQEACLSIPTHL